MAHISRRELKKDEFRDTLEHGVEVLSTHKKLIWQVGVVVVVAACAVFGWRYYSSHRNARASAAFSAAMKLYAAQVVAPGQSPPPGMLTYPSDTAKYTAAEKAMASVAGQYPHSRYGSMARYYAAVSLDHLGQYPDAVHWLEPMADHGSGQLRALAKFELAHVYDQMGNSAQAVALYQQLASQPTVFVPKPLVLLALGDHYRTHNDARQATKYYQQVKSEFPNTGLADQADQRLEMLGKS
ncbi:MAG TPA: tetratricopeptide repeat protein [Candidatus Dormibacteraeota bacterium]|nr:tetratricopeptide repeat protein [Candidatus Dormibacteraeota bacterium]